MLIDKITSCSTLDAALAHVTKARAKHWALSDIWDLRHNWISEREKIQKQLREGAYRLEAVTQIVKSEDLLEVWSARDAVVLKAVETALKEKMLAAGVAPGCCHLKGRGGLKSAVSKVRKNLKKFKYVFRTDVKKYYASIDHNTLFKILEDYAGERPVLGILYQFLKRTIYREGCYKSCEKGLCRGSSLSPLLGALYLKELDEAMKKSGAFYVRYMDDWVILSYNKRKFRKLIKKVNSVLARLKLLKAEDKTFIGKIERGFDFLGFHFGQGAVAPAQKTIKNFAENIAARIYDSLRNQETNHKGGKKPIPDSVSLYVQRFIRWVKQILNEEKDETIWRPDMCLDGDSSSRSA